MHAFKAYSLTHYRPSLTIQFRARGRAGLAIMYSDYFTLCTRYCKACYVLRILQSFSPGSTVLVQLASPTLPPGTYPGRAKPSWAQVPKGEVGLAR